MTTVNLNEISIDTYSSLKDNIENKILSDMSERHSLVKVIVDEYEIEMPKSQLLINLILLKPFYIFDKDIDIEFIYKETKMTEDILADYFNDLIAHFKDEDYKVLNTTISEIIENLADLSGEVNVKVGNSISLYSIIKLAEDNERFNELINYKIPNNIQLKEIEDYLEDGREELVEILSTNPNEMKNYLNSETGINTKQLAQVIMNVGLKPNLHGKVIPTPIDSNFLQGLRHVRDFYINSISGRKALITNFSNVRTSGLKLI